MNDAAFARRHGSEVKRRSGLANFLGSYIRSHPQFIHPNGALVLAIERNLFVIAGRQAQDFEGEQFQGAKQFSAAIEQQRGIGSGEIDKNFGLLPFAWCRRVYDDAVSKVKSTIGNDRLQELVDSVGGGEFIHREALSYQLGRYEILACALRICLINAVKSLISGTG
jgi:hypothetical protein